MNDKQLLQRAWDALDTFKQAYPENWHEEDQQVLDDLIKEYVTQSDPINKKPTKLLLIPDLMEQAGWVRKKEWVGLTNDEQLEAIWESGKDGLTGDRYDVALAIEAKLKEKNYE